MARECGVYDAHMSADQERVMEMLADFHLAKPWARVDPKTLSIDSVEAVGPTQVVLRSVYETRSIRYQLRPAKRPTFKPVVPDPWASEISFPNEAEAGTTKYLALAGTQIHLDCAACRSEGRVPCSECRGTGKAGGGRLNCFECDGRQRVFCKTCDGQGGVLGVPTIHAGLHAHQEIRTLGTEALPVELVLALGERAALGALIHREEGVAISELRLPSGGYRGEQVVSSKVIEAAHEVLARPGVPEAGRIQRQTLELKRTTVFQVRLTSGAVFYVWDNPVQVHPIVPLRSWLGRLLWAR
jgi:hypothetical protein